MGFVHRRPGTETVVTRVPFRGGRVQRDWRLETLPERQRMGDAWPLRWSKREDKPGCRFSGQTTTVPANDELVGGGIRPRRDLEHRRLHFRDAMQCRPGYRPVEDLLEPLHLGAMSALAAERHETVCEGDGGRATEGTRQVGHGARTHPPPEDVGLKRRAGVDLDVT